MTITIRSTDERPNSRLPTVGRLTVALLMVAVAFALAGCAAESDEEPGVASLGSSESTDAGTGDGSGGEKPSALAYSQCMREHGLQDFPDPNESGAIELQAEPGSELDRENPTFQAAEEACKDLLPDGAQMPEGAKEANIKYSACMRENGVKDFPDPNPDGGLVVGASPGGSLDPNNPTFQAAHEACKDLLPDGGGPGGTVESTVD